MFVLDKATACCDHAPGRLFGSVELPNWIIGG